MKNKKNHKKGFTLIELLVVVAIMGMLAALAVVALNNARARARDARRVSDIKQIQTALELYFLDNYDYPVGTNLHLGSETSQCLSSTGGTGWNGTCGGTVYMSEAPLNPAPYDEGGNCTDDTSAYIYSRDNSTSYHITYCIGSDIGNIAGAAEHSATPAGIIDDD